MWRMRSTFLCPWYEAFYFEQMDLAVWNQEIGSGSILKSYYASSSLIYSSLSTVGYHSPNSHSIWARNAQNLNGFFLMDKQTDWVIIRAWTVRNKIQCITYLLVCFLISEYVKGGGCFVSRWRQRTRVWWSWTPWWVTCTTSEYEPRTLLLTTASGVSGVRWCRPSPGVVSPTHMHRATEEIMKLSHTERLRHRQKHSHTETHTQTKTKTHRHVYTDQETHTDTWTDKHWLRHRDTDTRMDA